MAPRMTDQELADARIDRWRKTLRTTLDQHGLSPTDVARLAGFSPNILFNFFNGHSHSLSAKTMEKLAQVIPGATVDQLVGSDRVAREHDTLVVRSIAKAGEWRGYFDLPLMQQYDVALPINREEADAGAFAVEVHHPGAEQLYADGAILGVLPTRNCLDKILPGRRVILQRIHGRKMEVTVREVALLGDKAYLMPRTTHPEHQEAIEMPWPFQGRMWRHGEYRFEVAGLVFVLAMRDA
jgi:transcriptional regulator with XRE-family HTH domain